MIHEVDESLRAFVRRDAVDSSVAEVMFEAPTKEWSARRNSPTVDIYLYDIREDVRARQNGAYDYRDDEGMITERHNPPRYFKLSYLVTVWTQRPEDEHRLLSALLNAFLSYPAIPDELLVGATAGLDLPVTIEIAKPPPENRQISDVWSALGGELKPSLDLVIRAPMVVGVAEPVAKPPDEPLSMDIWGDSGQQERSGGARPGGVERAAAKRALDEASERAGGIRRARPARTARK